MLEKRGQRSHMPLICLLKILRKQMSAKLLETLCTSEMRNCYHRLSHLSLGPFFPPIRLTPNLDLTFLLVRRQLLESPAELKPQSGSPSPATLLIETICDAGRRQERPLPSQSLSGKKSIHVQPANKGSAEETQNSPETKQLPGVQCRAPNFPSSLCTLVCVLIMSLYFLYSDDWTCRGGAAPPRAKGIFLMNHVLASHFIL